MVTKLFKTKKSNAYFNLALCILFSASIPVATKKILVELNNLQSLFYLTIISTLTLGIIVIFQKKTGDFKSFSIKQYGLMFLLGFIGNYLYNVFLYGALEKTTASEGFILNYTWPMLVLVLSFIFLKDKVTVQKLIGILFSFFGIIIITTKGDILSFNFTNLQGDTLALSAAFSFALFSVLAKKFNFDKTVNVFIYFLSSLILIIPTVLVFSKIVVPSVGVWLWIIYLGVFVNGLTYIFWFNALDGGETHIVSNLVYLTPFISLIYISIFLREKILISAVAGGAIIVIGVLSQYIKINKIEEAA